MTSSQKVQLVNVHCIVRKEAVTHFQQNNTDAYVLLFDASKPLDKENYVKLFGLVLERGVQLTQLT